MDNYLKKDVEKVAKGLLSHGVTSFVPTLVTSPSEHYHKIIPVLQRREGTKDRAGVLGVHLEGPFINLEKKGAHHPDYISKFDKGFSDVEKMYGCLDNVSVVTLAPELMGSHDVIKKLTQKGITVSLGHSMANLNDGEEAVKAGASFITHLFNAMLPVSRISTIRKILRIVEIISVNFCESSEDIKTKQFVLSFSSTIEILIWWAS